MRRASVLIALPVLLILSASAAAQVVSISVDATTEDLVGKSFVYALKQEIARSATYKYADASSQTGGISLKVVTLSNDDSTQNNSSASVSVVMVISIKDQPLPYYLDQWVVHVGEQKTTDMARKMMANVDSTLDELRRILAKAK